MHYRTSVLTDLRNRGVKDVLFVCTDGLSGFPEAIDAVFPQAVNQTCIVHLVRQSLRYLSWKERKSCATELRRIYTASDADAARQVLDERRRQRGGDDRRDHANGAQDSDCECSTFVVGDHEEDDEEGPVRRSACRPGELDPPNRAVCENLAHSRRRGGSATSFHRGDHLNARAARHPRVCAQRSTGYC